LGHTLTIEVPQDVYEPLVETARQTGQSPEKLAAEWLVAATRTATNDPVEVFIGALSSDIPDWADRHDRYLGQPLVEELSGKKGE